MFLPDAILTYRATAVLTVAFSGIAVLGLPRSASAKECSPEIYSSVRAGTANASVEIGCDLSLSQGDVISKQLTFSGAKSSGSVLECNGATIDGRIIIRSTQVGDSWSAPTGITIKNCTLNGDIRMLGMGGDKLVQSSLQRGHIERAQAAAPSNITLAGLTIVADKRTPIYGAVGTKGMTVTGTTISGYSDGPAIYLDAESAANTVAHNTFAITTKNREVIAVDGSAHNSITGNVFQNPVNGGIFLYRNCGERGVIRHQPSQNNTITGNTFRYSGSGRPKPAVWLDSRKGKGSFCFTNPAYPFGSSKSNLDFAKFNVVSGNKLPGGSPTLIVNDDPANKVTNNR